MLQHGICMYITACWFVCSCNGCCSVWLRCVQGSAATPAAAPAVLRLLLQSASLLTGSATSTRAQSACYGTSGRVNCSASAHLLGAHAGMLHFTLMALLQHCVFVRSCFLTYGAVTGGREDVVHVDICWCACLVLLVRVVQSIAGRCQANLCFWCCTIQLLCFQVYY
jgi:hypothetical protein